MEKPDVTYERLERCSMAISSLKLVLEGAIFGEARSTVFGRLDQIEGELSLARLGMLVPKDEK